MMNRMSTRTVEGAVRLMVAGAWMSVAGLPAMADVVRNVVCTSPDAVNVEIVWSYATVPESALVVKETVPYGWSASFDLAANPAVAEVRREGSSISFLVPRANLTGSGRFSYRLTRGASQAAVPAVSGICRTSSLTGVITAGVVQGSVRDMVVAADPAEPAADEDDPVPADFRIEAFHVTPGDHPRATFAWKGTGNRPVAILWSPTLDGAAVSGSASAGSRKGADASAWTTFDTYVPAVSRSGAKAASPDAPIEYTPDLDAPAGFYRLVIEVEE